MVVHAPSIFKPYTYAYNYTYVVMVYHDFFKNITL